MEKTEKTIRLTLLGGVNEVGGNTVLLEDYGYNVKIFIDFGLRIKKYYNEYERGQSPSSVDEILRTDLLPDENQIPIDNLYTKEFREVKQSKETVQRNNTRHVDKDYP